MREEAASTTPLHCGLVRNEQKAKSINQGRTHREGRRCLLRRFNLGPLGSLSWYGGEYSSPYVCRHTYPLQCTYM